LFGDMSVKSADNGASKSPEVSSSYCPKLYVLNPVPHFSNPCPLNQTS
jgi:hypothetical protein